MRLRAIWLSMLAVALLAAGGLAGVAAQEATPQDGLGATPGAAQDALLANTFGLPELRITLTDGGYEGVPAETAAGLYVVTFTNNTNEAAAAAFIQLPEGMTVDDLTALAELAPPEGEAAGGAEAGLASPAATGGMDMASPAAGTDVAASPAAEDSLAWLFQTYAAGGPGAEPLQTVQGIVDLQPGNYAVWSDEIFSAIAPVPLTVTGDAMASPVAGVISANVTVTEINTEQGFDFQVAGTLAAGQNLIQVFNDSDQPHHMIVERAPGPITEDQVEQVLAFAAQAEEGATPPPGLPSEEDFVVAVYAATQSAGSTQYIAANLEPGYYVFLCFIPDLERGGIPHAFEGMYEVVQVA
jgi:hypothetical protein